MRRPAAVSDAEFVHHMRSLIDAAAGRASAVLRHKPNVNSDGGGDSDGDKRRARVGIALSGGVDSMALLVLLHRYYSQSSSLHNNVHLAALTVDHGLRPESADEASAVGELARRMGIQHTILKIPWSQPPFPPSPLSSSPSAPSHYEHAARQARLLLFHTFCRQHHIHALFLAHHADDQVETALFRRFTRPAHARPGDDRGPDARKLGWGGMRKVSRLSGWQALPHPAPVDAQRWACRPLLEIPKSRLISTCELHNVRWFEDPTNAETSHNPRNAVRRHLHQLELSHHAAPPTSEEDGQEKDADADAVKTVVEMTVDEAREEEEEAEAGAEEEALSPTLLLRKWVRRRSEERDEVDRQVASLLPTILAPSPTPPSTLLVLPSRLPSTTTPLVRQALVARMLDLCSPSPLGSSRARGGQKAVLDTIANVAHVLFGTRRGGEERKAFTPGSRVLFTPTKVAVPVDGHGGGPTSTGPAPPPADGDEPNPNKSNPKRASTKKLSAWRISRQPLPRTDLHLIALRVRLPAVPSSTVGEEEGWTLWDGRFFVRVCVRVRSGFAEIKEEEEEEEKKSRGQVVDALVEPHGPWVLPRVVVRPLGDDATELASSAESEAKGEACIIGGVNLSKDEERQAQRACATFGLTVECVFARH